MYIFRILGPIWEYKRLEGPKKQYPYKISLAITYCGENSMVGPLLIPSSVSCPIPMCFRPALESWISQLYIFRHGLTETTAIPLCTELRNYPSNLCHTFLLPVPDLPLGSWACGPYTCRTDTPKRLIFFISTPFRDICTIIWLENLAKH